MTSLNSILVFFSVIILFVITFTMGLLGMPFEMGLSILSGALGIVFSNIENIVKYNRLVFSKKVKRQVQAIINARNELPLAQHEIKR